MKNRSGIHEQELRYWLRGVAGARKLLVVTMISVLGLLSLAPATVEAARRRVKLDDRTIASHALRRMAFGPTLEEVDRVAKLGLKRYVTEQLNPQLIDDSQLEARLAAIPNNPNNPDTDITPFARRWYVRMAYSKRQLQERVTLFWHEHFSTSYAKGGMLTPYMFAHENLFRQKGLGSFRDLLVEITKDQAMLIWLDNNNNRGDNLSNNGVYRTPNENYARELLQLFSLGTAKLNMDGTPVLDSNGDPIPAYTETDIREISRALTGWRVITDRITGNPNPVPREKAVFQANWHDPRDKTFFGQVLRGRAGDAGALEVEDVIDRIMAQPSVAPFIAKLLIQKFATETPNQFYVERVAKVFQATNGDIKATLQAVLLDPEFLSPRVVKTQLKTPIELFIGAIRALDGVTTGTALINWTRSTGHYIYFPPDVFGFYSPGNKIELLDTNYVLFRDNLSNDLAFAGATAETRIPLDVLKGKYALDTAEKAVDTLADALFQEAPEKRTRASMIKFLNANGPSVTDDDLRGLIWLLLVSPDYHRN